MRIIREAQVLTAPADPAQFSGAVFRTDYPTGSPSLIGVRFVYGPSSRSFWHVHDDEQLLVIQSGQGVLQWTGAEAELLHPGDLVYIVPGIAHWHGALPDGYLAHLAVNTSGAVTWQHAVSDEDYERATRPGLS
jgi:quercetin dioxygenase-like cupin family protein